MPGYDWEAEKRDFWNGRVDVAMGMLPLTLLGLGRASLKDIHGAQEMLAQDQVLASAGIPEADRRAIVEMAQNGQGPEALAGLQDAWGRREPATAAEHQKLMSGQEAHVEHVYNEAMERGLMPEVTPTEDGHFTVKDSSGTEAKFTTRQDALNAASHVMTEAQQAEVAAMLAAAVDGKGSTGSSDPTAIPVEAAPSDSGQRVEQPSAESPGPTNPATPEPSLDAVHADAVSQGLIPPIQQRPDGKYIITDSEGTPAIYDNRQEAVQDSFLFMTPEQRQKVFDMVEGKQNADGNKTAPVEQQTATTTVNEESPQSLTGDGGKTVADTSGSTEPDSTASASTSRSTASSHPRQGEAPPAPPSQTNAPPPPLWQGNIGLDSQGRMTHAAIHGRNADGSYRVSIQGKPPVHLNEADAAALSGMSPAELHKQSQAQAKDATRPHGPDEPADPANQIPETEGSPGWVDDSHVVKGAARFDQVPDMIQWEDNPDGSVRSVDEAKKIFRDNIKDVEPTMADAFDLLDVVEIKVVSAGWLGNNWAQYHPQRNTSKIKGHLMWRDFYDEKGRIIIHLDERVLKSDQAALGIIAHELYELDSIRKKFGSHNPIPSSQLQRFINDAHSAAVEIQNRSVEFMKKKSK